jgi:hypothetical protein
MVIVCHCAGKGGKSGILLRVIMKEKEESRRGAKGLPP